MASCPYASRTSVRDVDCSPHPRSLFRAPRHKIRARCATSPLCCGARCTAFAPSPTASTWCCTLRPTRMHKSETLGYWKTIEDDYHWHIEILPILGPKAKSYTFKEVYSSPVSPESAAARLARTPDRMIRILNGQYNADALQCLRSSVMTVRRLKTYTAQTGYVYEYYFVGKRPALRRRPARPLNRIHLRHQLRPQDHLRRERVSARRRCWRLTPRTTAAHSASRSNTPPPSCGYCKPSTKSPTCSTTAVASSSTPNRWRLCSNRSASTRLRRRLAVGPTMPLRSPPAIQLVSNTADRVRQPRVHRTDADRTASDGTSRCSFRSRRIAWSCSCSLTAPHRFHHAV